MLALANSACVCVASGTKEEVTLPNGLEQLVILLKTHFVQRKQDLPDSWCRALLSEGRVSELIELDSSAKTALGPVVDRHLRAARVVHFAGLPSDKTNSYFFEDTWTKTDCEGRRGCLHGLAGGQAE